MSSVTSEQLRERARRYLLAADKINQAADVLEPPRPYARRLAQVQNYLREHGPAKRTEIIADTGIPEGTVAFLLKDKRRFARDDERKWHNTVR